MITNQQYLGLYVPAAGPLGAVTATVAQTLAATSLSVNIEKGATWTTPRTWIPGEMVTAAMMNQQVRDNLMDLRTRLLAQNWNALDASKLTLGTVPDARIPSNILRQSTQRPVMTHMSFDSVYPNIGFSSSITPTNQRYKRIRGWGGAITFETLNDAGNQVLSTDCTVYRSGNVATRNAWYEKGRTAPVGDWIQVGSTNVVGTGAMSCTVINWYNCAISLVGKTLILSIRVTLRTAGTANGQILIGIPGGYVAARTCLSMTWTCHGIGYYACYGYVPAGNNNIYLVPWNETVHGIGDFWVYGQMFIPIQ